MNQIKITCPNCNETFSADEALRNHLKAKDEQHAKEIENNKKIAQEKHNLELKLMEKKAAKIAEDKAKAQIQQNKAKHELDLKQVEKKIIKNAEAETEKLKKEIVKKDKAWEIQEKRYEKRVDEMKKQMNQRSVELQGEVQEELIQDFLRNSFPEDTVEEIKKGARGADCLFSINYKDKKNLAQIYFESKDHKSFKEEWVDKLLKDMKTKNIGHSILVTTALPKDFNKAKNGYVGRHGNRIIIIPDDDTILHAVVSLIRGNLINMYKTKKDLNVSKELTKLWDHITGPSFQIPMRTLYLSINKSHILLEKEKTFWNKHLSNKEKNLTDMKEQFLDVINSFTLKVADNLLPETLVQVETSSNREKNNINSVSINKNKADN